MSEEIEVAPPAALTAPEDFDRLELAALASFPAINLPLVHTFTPGLYVRRIFMPKDTFCTSKIHKTEHPFVVLSGKAFVFNLDTRESVLIEAPYFGVTKPGTRRALLILEDCTWLTFHPLEPGEEGDLEAIETRIIERRELADGKTAFDHWQELLAAQPELLAAVCPEREDS